MDSGMSVVCDSDVRDLRLSKRFCCSSSCLVR